MEKTILLGLNNGFSVGWTRALYLTVFVCNAFIALSFITREGSLLWRLLGILMIFSALYYLVHGVLAFSRKSKYAPRVSVDKNLILIREKLMKQTIEIPWQQIKGIQFSQNQIVFSKPDSEYEFSYQTNSDISLQIKSAIREVAESKEIEISGG